MDIYTSMINGVWLEPGESKDRHNPGNLDELACQYSLVGGKEAKRAMDSARAAFPSWRSREASDRLGFLGAWLDRIEAETETFAGVITRENGKGLAESRAEVGAALRDGRYLLEIAARDLEAVPTASQFVVHEPLGVFLLITPWNFPLATLVRKLVPALAYGNTVVVKPSEMTPGAAREAFKILEMLHLPPGVANLILGKGREVGPVLVDHEALRGISLTGSTLTGRDLQERTAGRDVRLQLEMGGKNALMVLADADLGAAAEAAVIGAFSCAGQWCTGTSRVIVEGPVYAEFLEHLLGRVKEIRVGPGHEAISTMGPVAYEGHFHEVMEAIQLARREGAPCLAGGASLETVDGCRGWFIEPTVFGPVEADMNLFREEIFGPVLAVTRATDRADAIRLANQSAYGLSFSVFTGNRERGLEVVSQIESGICHVNLHTAYRVPELPVSGWKESGRGLPECGPYAQSFFTQPKAIYLGPES